MQLPTELCLSDINIWMGLDNENDENAWMIHNQCLFPF